MMGRPRRGIGAELLAVALLGGCLAGTLAAVMSVYRRPSPKPVSPTVVLAPPAPAPKGPEPGRPAPAPAPAAPAVDPTQKIVAELAAATDEQRAEAEKAAQRIAALETATKAALAESDRWKRNLALTRAQLDAREAEANRLEGEAQMAGFERNALARRREIVKQALDRDLQRPGYAVLPHRGPHGTWQRPIVVECNGEGVILRPANRQFSLGEIASPFELRASSFLLAVTREAVRIQRRDAPDGGEVVPYIFFIVRPDGIRSYYEARTRLERIGIAFGYELADSDWAIDVPNLDDPATWDGSPPPLNPGSVAAAPVREPGRGGDGSPGGGGDRPAIHLAADRAAARRPRMAEAAARPPARARARAGAANAARPARSPGARASAGTAVRPPGRASADDTIRGDRRAWPRWTLEAATSGAAPPRSAKSPAAWAGLPTAGSAATTRIGRGGWAMESGRGTAAAGPTGWAALLPAGRAPRPGRWREAWAGRGARFNRNPVQRAPDRAATARSEGRAMVPAAGVGRPGGTEEG